MRRSERCEKSSLRERGDDVVEGEDEEEAEAGDEVVDDDVDDGDDDENDDDEITAAAADVGGIDKEALALTAAADASPSSIIFAHSRNARSYTSPLSTSPSCCDSTAHSCSSSSSFDEAEYPAAFSKACIACRAVSASMCTRGDRAATLMSAGSDSEGGVVRMSERNSLFKVSEVTADANVEVGRQSLIWGAKTGS